MTPQQEQALMNVTFEAAVARGESPQAAVRYARAAVLDHYRTQVASLTSALQLVLQHRPPDVPVKRKLVVVGPARAKRGPYPLRRAA
jgi:hypothetical protein